MAHALESACRFERSPSRTTALVALTLIALGSVRARAEPPVGARPKAGTSAPSVRSATTFRLRRGAELRVTRDAAESMRTQLIARLAASSLEERATMIDWTRSGAITFYRDHVRIGLWTLRPSSHDPRALELFQRTPATREFIVGFTAPVRAVPGGFVVDAVFVTTWHALRTPTARE